MFSKFICFTNNGEFALITDNIKYTQKKFEQVEDTKIMKIVLRGEEIGQIKSSFFIEKYLEVVYCERTDVFAALTHHPSKKSQKIIFLKNGHDVIHNFDTSIIEKMMYFNTIKIIGGDLCYLKSSQKLVVVKNLKFDLKESHRNFTIDVAEGKIKDFLILKKSRVLIAYLAKRHNKSEPVLILSLYSATGNFLTKSETQKKGITSMVASPDSNYVACVVKSNNSTFSLVLLQIKGDGIFTLDSFYLSSFSYFQGGAVISFNYGVDSRYLISVFPQVGKKGKKKDFAILVLTIFDGKFVVIETVETEYRKFMVNCLENGSNESIGIANKNLCVVKYSVLE